MSNMSKVISLVVPVYNEEKNIDRLFLSLHKVIKSLSRYTFEVIFVNDGSSDGSLHIIKGLSRQYPYIKYIDFSRNFGKEIATSAGLMHARGDAVIMIDADLQHPPELIPEFINRWHKGFDVVIGVRQKNKGEGIIKKAGSYFFYKVLTQISETDILPHSTDFRLIDKKVLQEFNKLTEHNRMTRGLIDWLGFRRDYIYFIANERTAGNPGYHPFKLVKLALSAFVSHSLFPLKFAGYLGIGITSLAGLLGLFIIVEKYILNDPFRYNFSGPAMLAVAILFLVGMILSSLGLIALYIATIHAEVVNRPLYIIREKENF